MSMIACDYLDKGEFIDSYYGMCIHVSMCNINDAHVSNSDNYHWLIRHFEKKGHRLCKFPHVCFVLFRNLALNT